MTVPHSGRAGVFLTSLGGLAESARVVAQAPASTSVNFETVIQLVPQLAIAFALFLVVKYYDDKNNKERDRSEAQRKIDLEQQSKENERREASLKTIMAEFKTALAESNAQTERHTSDIVAELKSSSQLDRDMHNKAFDSVVSLTRDTVGRMMSLEESVRTIQRDIKDVRELTGPLRVALPGSEPAGGFLAGPRAGDDPPGRRPQG